MDLQSLTLLKHRENKLADFDAQAEDAYYAEMGKLPWIMRAPGLITIWVKQRRAKNTTAAKTLAVRKQKATAG